MKGTLIQYEADPKNQGPCTDHVPILTVLDLSMRKGTTKLTRNFTNTDWEEFKKELNARMCNADFLEA